MRDCTCVHSADAHDFSLGALCTKCPCKKYEAAPFPLEGRKHDGGKDRWDLLPLGLVEGIVKVLTFGAKKYAPNNWQKLSDPHGRYYSALMRHLVKYRSGEWLDMCEFHNGVRPDGCESCSGLPHLFHVGCNTVFLFHFGPYKADREVTRGGNPHCTCNQPGCGGGCLT